MTMQGGRIEYQIGYSVDQKSLQQLQTSLDRVLAEINLNTQSGGLSQELQKSVGVVKELDAALSKTVNKDLGQLNVRKFTQELSKSNVNIQSIKTSLQDLASKGVVSVNEAANAFHSLGTTILGTNMKIKESSKLMDSMATSMANTVKWGLTSSVFKTITSSISNAVSYTKQLDSSLNDIRIVTDKSAQSMEKFAEKANTAAKNLGKSTLDYTNASLIYYQQGLKDEDVEARTATTLKAASVTGQSADEVSEQLTAVWNGYKVSAAEAEKYVDKLAAVAATTASDLEELSTGMSKVASAANAMGVDVDQLNAQLSTIISVTRQAPESAGTALKTIFARMGDLELDGEDEFGVKLGEVSSSMKSMGIDILTAKGELRDMGEVIEEVGNKWNSGTWSEAEKQALAIDLAGKRQYNNLLALFDNWDKYQEALETSKDSAGTLEKQQQIYLQSTEAHLNQLKATWQDLYKGLINEDELNVGIDLLKNVVQVFDNFIDSFGGGIKSIVAFGAVVSNIFNKQISSAIIRAVNNHKAFQENVALLQQKMEQLKAGNFSIGDTNITTDSAMGKSMEASYNIQLEQAQRINAAKAAITNEEQNALTAMQQEVGVLVQETAYYDALVQESQAKASSEIQRYDFETQSITTILDLQNNQLSIQEALANKTNEVNNYLVAQLDNLSTMSSTEASANVEEEKRKDIVKSLLSLHTQIAKTIKESNNLSEEEKKKLSEQRTKISDIVKTLKQKISNAEQFASYLTSELKTIRNINDETQEQFKTEQKINQILQEQADIEKKADSARMKQGQATEAMDDALNKVEQSKGLATTITTITSSLSSLAMAWSSFNMVLQVWNDDSASFGEKILQTLMSAGMVIPTVISAFQKLNETTAVGNTLSMIFAAHQEKKYASQVLESGLLDTLNAKDAVQQYLDNNQIKLTDQQIARTTALVQAKLAESGATDTATGAQWGFNAAMAANSVGAILTVVIALVAALGALCFWLIQSANSESAAEKEAKKYAEAAKDAANAAQTAADAFEKLRDTINKYDEGVKGLQELEEGTEAYTEAIKEANEQVMELIRLNKDLAQYIQRDEQTGVLKFQEGALDKALASAEQKKNIAQTGADMVQIQSNNADFKVQTEKAWNEMVGQSSYYNYNYDDVFDEIIKETSESGGLQREDVIQLDSFKERLKHQLEYDGQNLETFDFDSFVDELAKAGSKDINDVLNKYNIGDYYQEEIRSAIDTMTGVAAHSSTQTLANDQKTKEAQNEIFKQNAIQTALSSNSTVKAMDISGQNAVSALTSSQVDIEGEEYKQIVKDIEEKYKDDYGADEDAHIEWMGIYHPNWKYRKDGNGEGIFGNEEDEEVTVPDKQIYNELQSYHKGIAIKDLADRTGQSNADFVNKVSKTATSSLGTNFSSQINGILARNDASKETVFDVSQLDLKDVQRFQSMSEQEIRAMFAGLEDQFGVYEEGFDGFIHEIMEGQKNIDLEPLYERMINEATEGINTLSSAISSLAKGDDLTPDTIEALENKQESLKLILDKNSDEYKQALEDIREWEEKELTETLALQAKEKFDNMGDAAKNFKKNINDNLSFEEANKNFEAYKKSIEEFVNTRYQMEISVTDDLLSDIDNIVSKAENAAMAIEKIGDGFKVAADDSEQLFKVFPELAHNAYVLANGQIQLDHKVVSEILGGDAQEIDSQKTVTAQKIKERIQELEAKKKEAQDRLEQIKNTTAAELDAQGLLGQNAQSIADYETQINEQMEKDKVFNSGESAKAIIDNWGQTELAAVDVALTSQEATEYPYKTEGPRIAKSAYKSAVKTSSATQNNSDKFSAEDLAKQQEQLKDLLIKSTENEIESYETQIAELVTGWGKLYSSVDNMGEKAKESADKAGKDVEILKDKYHDVNVQLKLIENELNRIEKLQSKLSGVSLLSSLNEELAYLKAQNEQLDRRIKIRQEDIAEQKENLKGMGFSFDEETGQITNFMDFQDKYIVALNSATTEDDRQGIKEDFDKKLEAAQEYENALNEELEADLQQKWDNIIKIQEKELEKIQYKITVELDIYDVQRSFNKIIKEWDSKINNKFSSVVAVGVASIKDASTYLGNGDLQGELSLRTTKAQEFLDMPPEKLDKLYGVVDMDTGEIKEDSYKDSQKYWDDMKEHLNNIGDAMEKTKTSIQSLSDAIDDAVDEINNAFENELKAQDALKKTYEHNIQILKLIKGENAYQDFDQHYDAQLSVNYQSLQTLNDQKAMYEELMAKETNPEKLKEYQQKYNEILDELQSKTEETLQLVIDKMNNAISATFEALNKEVTNGIGLDWVEQEWNMVNKQADRYLDTINSTYNVEKLAGKYRKTLDNTTSVNAQKKISKFMEEELSILKSKDKLSQYDLDRANKRYELMVKQIELEESQNNKTTMRLRRDAQGNYSYQFVANEDDTGDKQQEVSDLTNELYNMDKNQQKNTVKEYFDTWKEMQSAMQSISVTDPERDTKLNKLRDYYGGLLEDIGKDLDTSEKNLIQSFGMSIADLQKNDAETFTAMTGLTKDNIEQLTGFSFKSIEDLSIFASNKFQETYDGITIGLSNFIPTFDTSTRDMADKIKLNLFDYIDTATAGVSSAWALYEAGIKKTSEEAGPWFQSLVETGYNPLSTAQQEILDNQKAYRDFVVDELMPKIAEWKEKLSEYEAEYEKLGEKAIEVATILQSNWEEANKAILAATAAYEEANGKEYSDTFTHNIVTNYTTNGSPTDGGDVKDQSIQYKGKTLSYGSMISYGENEGQGWSYNITDASGKQVEGMSHYGTEGGPKEFQELQQQAAGSNSKNSGTYMYTDQGWVQVDYSKQHVVFSSRGNEIVDTSTGQVMYDIYGNRTKNEGSKKYNYGDLNITKQRRGASWGNYDYYILNDKDGKKLKEGDSLDKICTYIMKELQYEASVSTKLRKAVEAQKKESFSNLSFDTGGFTGDWGNEGRLAFLHQKELVLNAEDTENILSAVNVVRGMSGLLASLVDVFATQAQGLMSVTVPAMWSGASISGEAQQLEQNVHIEANFPNATDEESIKTAMIDLINIASQQAMNTMR